MLSWYLSGLGKAKIGPQGWELVVLWDIPVG